MNIFNIFRRKREKDFGSVLSAARSKYRTLNQYQVETLVPNLFNYKARYEFLVERGLGCTVQAITLKRTITEIEESKQLKQEADRIDLFISDIERHIRSFNLYATIDFGGYLITYDDFDRITDLFDLSAFPIRFYCGEATTVIKGSLAEIVGILSTYKKQKLFNRIKEDDNRPVFVKEIRFCNDVSARHPISRYEKKRICEYVNRHHRILIPRQSYSTMEDQWASRDLNLNHMLEETGIELSVVNRNFYITGMGLTYEDVLIACSSEFMNLSGSDKVVQDIPERGFLFQYTPYGVLIWMSFDNDQLKEVGV